MDLVLSMVAHAGRSQVYTQVTALFKDATDLLDEFKAFLPDPNAPQPPGALLGGRLGGGLFGAVGPSPGPAPPGQPPVHVPSRTTSPAVPLSDTAAPPSVVGVKRQSSLFGNFGKSDPMNDPSLPAQKKKRGGPPGQMTAGPPIQTGVPKPSAAQALDAAANRPVTKTKRGRARLGPGRDPSPDGYDRRPEPAYVVETPAPTAAYPAYVEAHGAMQGRTLTSARELMFFDNAKRYLKDRDVWMEFLRVCDLYSKEIINFSTLMDRASVFIGDNDDLLEDFKGLVGYDVTNDGLVEDEVWEIKNTPLHERGRLDPMSLSGSYGPSYKRLPPGEIDLACSGRDDLCWSVLNDRYFAAAVIGTESGYSHRKSIYEDACHSVEHERAHYSYWLDCISRTVAHFEAIEARIDSMDDQERHNFRLGYNLGGQSPSIYNRTLRKIYETKYRTEVAPLLEDHPAATVPVVLRRLKEVEQTWRHAELQWQTVWREVERKNFYRARDAIGTLATYKASEKAATKAATLLKELHDLKEQGAQRRIVADDSRPTPRASHQYELGFEDEEVFEHTLNFLAIFVERTSTSKPERKRAWEVLRAVMPVLGLTADDVERHFPPLFDDDSESETFEDGDDEDEEDARSEAGTSVTAAASAAPSGKNVATKQGADDLRKRLLSAKSGALDAEREGSNKPISPAPSSPPEPEPDSEVPLPCPDDHSSSDEEEFLAAMQPAVPVEPLSALGGWQSRMTSEQAWSPEPEVEKRYNLFGTSAVFVAFRTIHVCISLPGATLANARCPQTLYSRLLEIKSAAQKLDEEEPTWHRVNPLAVDLGLTFIIPGVDDHPRPASQMYPFILDQFNRYCSFEIEMPVLEEELRVLFPMEGYKLLTADKLCQIIYKQVRRSRPMLSPI